MSAEKRWVLKEQGDPATVTRLATALDIPPVLANLLVQRGIDTEEKANRFFNPKLENLHDPFLMKDLRKAVERIDLALTRGETIMVYGDYDVDGTTAVALVYLFLRKLGHRQLMFYIPDRYTEGYGVSRKAIEYALRKGVGLIITLDCGIKATEKVAYAKELGIDMIICDHHLPGEQIPDAVAVLDPKQPECQYPFKELSGCGVGFKFMQAFAISNGIEFHHLIPLLDIVAVSIASDIVPIMGENRILAYHGLKQLNSNPSIGIKMLQGYCLYKGLPFSEVECLLDLVVVSIASDIVPLVGENRILAYYGLKRLNEKPGKGLQSIIKICGLEKHAITIDDIVFKIGPRINAAGRMEVDSDDENAAPSGGHSAVSLMVARDDEVAREYGAFIDRSNQDRKNIDRSVTSEAHEYIECHPHMKELKSTVIYNPKWMKGIVGIVASRLIETYYRPTVVLTMSNGFVTGSARSVPGFDLYQAVESCADLLENFGGHMYAAGMTMKPDNVEEFTKRFNDYVEEHIDPEMLIPQVDIDSELLFSDITPRFRSTLARFQPFGPGNNAPVFMTRGVSNRGDARLVGAEHEHLKMDLIQGQKPNTAIAAIAFQQPKLYEYVRSGRSIDVCYTVVENHYRGEVFPQLRVKDIKKSVQ